MPAFQLAWQMGADGIELDVQLSRDHEIVVHHDSDTRRSAGVDLKVAETDSAALRRLDVGRLHAEQFHGTQIPLLSEVLAQVPDDKRVLIEVKCDTEAIIPALTKVLTQYTDAAFRLALISFHLDTLIACRNAFPTLPCYPVFSYQYPDSSSDITTLNDWIGIAQQYGFAGLDPDYRDITPEFAAAVKAAGLELITWTVNDPACLNDLQAIGVDAIATDWPEKMRAMLNLTPE